MQELQWAYIFTFWAAMIVVNMSALRPASAATSDLCGLICTHIQWYICNALHISSPHIPHHTHGQTRCIHIHLFHTHSFIPLAQFVLVVGYMVTHAWGAGDFGVRRHIISLWTIKWLWKEEEAAATEIVGLQYQVKENNVLEQKERKGRGRKSYKI